VDAVIRQRARATGKFVAAPIRGRAPRDVRTGPPGLLHPTEPSHVVQLQRTCGNAATAALLRTAAGPLTIQRQPKKQPADPTEQAGALLRGFEAWASDEKQRQHVVETAAVVGLDPKQAAGISSAAAKLAGYLPTMRKAGATIDPSLASLQQAVDLAKQAKAKNQSRDSIDRMEAGHLTTQSGEAVTRAIGQVGQIGSGVDVTGLKKNLTTIAKALQTGGSLADILKYLTSTISDLRKVRAEVGKRADAAQRIDVLLRAFLALNDPAFKGAPTAKELKDVKSLLAGGLGEEFTAVFGTSVDYDTFVEFANTLSHQIEARDQMAAASGTAAPRMPGQGDAQAYFGALAAKGNADVFDAYEKFALAFFFHRGIASVADLLLTAPDLFATKASITGRRGLVCTGYATMGAQVLAGAGAHLDGFSVGIHASDEMVRSDTLDEQGHAVARMTRRGTAFCVSNASIVPTKNALVGPGAIAWGNQQNPLFVGEGPTNEAAVKNLLAKVAEYKRRLGTAKPARRK